MRACHAHKHERYAPHARRVTNRFAEMSPERRKGKILKLQNEIKEVRSRSELS